MKKFLILWSIFGLLLTGKADAQGGRTRDSLALVAIYNALDGANWLSTTGPDHPWLNGPINTWYGVTVDGSYNRVTAVYLGYHSLKGQLPNAIGRLDSVGSLYLSGNKLSGGFPDSLFQLKALTYLYLSDARNQYDPETQSYPYGLTGTIPSQFTNLTNLAQLYLSGNRFAGTMPTFWSSMSALRALDLSVNDFTGTIPSGLGSATQLTHLWLKYNNNLTAGPLPSEFANLVNLTTLDVTSCNITSLPNMSALTNLDQLHVGQNLLTGPIPSWIGSLTGLNSLELRYNYFDPAPMPEWIFGLTSLTSLLMEGDSLSGPIDPRIGRLTNLGTLWLSNNVLTGTVPDSINNLTSLNSLWLHDNQLFGSFPSILSLGSLNTLYLYSNQFTGLPNLSSLTNLNNFSVYVNKLTFEDVEPNLPRFGGAYNYSPQDSIGLLKDTLVTSGAPVTMSVAGIPVGGTGTKSYQWLKDGVPISGATNSMYTISSVSAPDAAPYVCQITDGNVPGLTLNSRVFNLRVIIPPLAVQDSLALIAMFDSLNGGFWTTNLNWGSSLPVSEWYGVTVTPFATTSRVTAIQLNSNNMEGVLPSLLGNLDSLKTFNVAFNRITGPLPKRMAYLKALETLDIYGNRYLNSDFGVTSLPDSMGLWKRLKALNAYGNRFTSIPGGSVGVGGLSSIEVINFYDNQLVTIPSDIWSLTTLQYLEISGNYTLEPWVLPPAITGLVNLNYLILYGTNLTGIPDMSSMTELKYISFANNALTGSIPAFFGSMTGLESLDLGSNRFSPGSFPVFLLNLTSLTSLSLYGDSLFGTIPDDISDMTMLNTLNLGDNQLEGDVPVSITTLNLGYLGLAYNKLTGLPDFSSVTSLYGLDVNNNKLTFEDIEPNIGEPSSYFNYSPQGEVGVQRDTVLTPGEEFTSSASGIPVGGSNNQYQWTRNGNDIQGAVSIDYTIGSVVVSDGGSYVCKITDLNVPDLTLFTRPINLTVLAPAADLADSLALVDLYDSLNGVNWSNQGNWKSANPIGTWYGVSVADYENVTRVVGINLNSNNLSGTIPTSIGTLDSLDVLDIGWATYSGSFPDTIFNLKRLWQLNLAGNSGNGLQGPLPARIGELTRLQVLNLNDNNLTGALPAELFGMPSLSSLTLRNNQFNGLLSTSIGSLTLLNQLDLAGNQFTGELPAQIANLSNLQYLTLSNNQFSGPFPNFLWSMTGLRSLDLAFNTFSPSELSPNIQNLSNIEYLRLASDSLTGLIPSEIGNITAPNFYYLDLGRNAFVGSAPDSLSKLINLSYLFLNHNQLTMLPNLSALNLFQFNVSNNKLGFDDLLPNLDAVYSTYQYNPQDSLGAGGSLTVLPGSPFTLTANHYNNGSNVYNWYRNKSFTGVADSVYNVASASPTNIGGFSCRITNPALPNLTLHTKTLRVVLEAAPAAPSNLTAVPGNYNAKLTWRANPDGDLKGYYIYSGPNLNPTVLVDSVMLAGAGSFIDTTRTIYGLNNGTRYYFRIKALDSLGLISNYSNEVSAVIGDLTPPAIPANALAFTGNLDASVWWDPSEDTDFSYHIVYRSTQEGFSPTDEDSIAATADHVYFDADVDNEVTYYYRIAAVDSFGNRSAAGASVSVTPSALNPSWLATGRTGQHTNVFSANERQVWAVGVGGLISHSSDGGLTWETQISNTSNILRDIFFVDSLIGWAAGDFGTILKTTDGGANWLAQSSGGTQMIRTIYFTDALNGWMGIPGTTFRRTTDGGDSWIPAAVGPGLRFRGMYFSDVNKGWGAAYGLRFIYQTVDGGVSWSVLFDFSPWGTDIFMRNLDMVDASVGYAVGGRSAFPGAFIAKTTDGGVSWTDLSSNLSFPVGVGEIWGIDFINANEGWISTVSGYIFKTTDGGSNWEYQSNRTVASTAFLYDIHARPSGQAWATNFNSNSPIFRLGTASPGSNQPPVANLSQPAGNDTVYAGRAVQIVWNVDDDQGVSKSRLEYTTDGSNYVLITQVLSSGGVHIWTVPEDWTNGQVKFRVTGYDIGGLTDTHESPFSTVLPGGAVTHITNETVHTFLNNGRIGGTVSSVYFKPSLRYGNVDNHYAGQMYFGYLDGADTVGIGNLFLDNYYPTASMMYSEGGGGAQSSAGYIDRINAGVSVQQTIYSKDDDKFFIVEYKVTNVSGQTIDNLFIGQWNDFDVGGDLAAQNVTGFDAAYRLGFMYPYFDSTIYAGVRMMDFDPSTFRRYFSGNDPAGVGGHYMTMSSGFDDPSTDTPSDYRLALSRGPFFLNAGQSTTVSFAICVAGSLNDLRTVSDNAQNYYDALRVPPSAPTNLNATAASDDQIDLSWNAGTNTVRYRVYRSNSGGGPFTQIDSVASPATNYSDDELSPVTTYFYQVKAVNNFGVSSATNTAQATTLAPPAPEAPTQLAAQAVSASQIDMVWHSSRTNNPVRYKIFASEDVNTNYVQIDSVAVPDTTYSADDLEDNTQYFFRIFASNGFTVSTASNEASATTGQIAPSFGAVNFVSSPNEGQSVTVTANVSGSDPEVKIFYGTGSQLVGDSVTLSESSGSYQFSIPSNKVTYQGVWFTIRATNQVGAAVYPSSGRTELNVQVNNASVTTVVNNGSYPSGVVSEEYSTVSLPLNTALNLATQLGDQGLKNGRPTIWRLVQYNAATGTFSDVTTMQNGVAYFLFIRSDLPNVQTFANMSPGNTNPKTLFDNINLQPGWNLVPWPFAFTANVTITDPSKVDPIQQMSGGNWGVVSQLKPFGGFAIKNKTASTVTLSSAVAWTTVGGKPKVGDWSIRLMVEKGERHDRDNYLGVSAAGTDGFDIYDVSEMTMDIGKPLSLHFPMNDGFGKIEKLAWDLRSPEADVHVWDMAVDNPRNERELDLSWEFQDLPQDHKAVLIDVSNNRFINLGEQTAYRFVTHKTNPFRVVAGKADVVDGEVERIRATMPTDFALRQNYPNPFNPSTTINFDVALSSNVRVRVYNVLGQEVATLVDRYFETGSHQVQWNGRDASGRQVASGVYIYRLEAERISRTRKMLLLK